MYQLTGTEKYKSDIESNTNQLIDQNQFTPGGMIFYQPWGPARHAANAAFLARQAVSSGIGMGLKQKKTQNFLMRNFKS